MNKTNRPLSKFRNVSKLLFLVLVSFSIAITILGYKINPVTADNSIKTAINFKFLSEEQGWLLINNRLYWTNSGGENWLDITPETESLLVIHHVDFTNSQNGTLIWSINDVNDLPSYKIAKTKDSGNSWEIHNIDIAFENVSPVKTVFGFWLNENTGWLVFQHATGVNFSIGTLFKTIDGGVTWKKYSIPIAAPVHFVSEEIGWIVGGASADKMYKTLDGGKTWNEIIIHELDGQRVILSTPNFLDADHGFQPVIVKNENEDHIRIYSTEDGGNTWHLVVDRLSETSNNHLVYSYFDLKSVPLIFVVENRLNVVKDSTNEEIMSLDGKLQKISELNMITQEIGFSLQIDSNCTPQRVESDLGTNIIDCTIITDLLRTNDGGKTWESINLPVSNFHTFQSLIVDELQGDVVASGFSNTEIFIGQGFDKCAYPTLSELQTWMNYSPYRVVNLYIGGENRACPSSTPTASFVNQAYKQGWKFIPTWVGLQAPCYSGKSTKMSSDPAVSFSQGVNEANKAVDVLSGLGLTDIDKTGSIVYYDIEAYNGDSVCEEAVKSFINGWSSQLHVQGNLVGIYGSSCGSHLLNYFTNTNIPDAIWPASWYGYGSYNANASVWEVPCISDNLYASHQRIRQYEGGHTENWGGVSLNIDSNVLDGIVAIPNEGISLPSCPETTSTRAYVCEPSLAPSYTNSCSTFWYPFTGFNGNAAYLTENAQTSSTASNTGEWIPDLPQAGRYKVEAYLAHHGTWNVSCSWGTATLGPDTSNAKYSIRHKDGTSAVTKNQLPYDNEWISLGEYNFNAGTGGYVTLTDLTGESQGSTNISLSAMRFTLVTPVAPSAPGLVSPANGATVEAQDTIVLDWNEVSVATEYYVEFWGGPDVSLNSGWISGTSFDVSSSVGGGDYQWRVKARNAGGESSWSITRSLTKKYRCAEQSRCHKYNSDRGFFLLDSILGCAREY